MYAEFVIKATVDRLKENKMLFYRKN